MEEEEKYVQPCLRGSAKPAKPKKEIPKEKKEFSLQICDTEDDLLNMQARFRQLEQMDSDDEQFTWEEYENLEAAIDKKTEMLIDMRSHQQTLELYDNLNWREDKQE